MMRAEVTYLDNSGFMVDTGGRLLIFDYYNDRPAAGKRGLMGGAIDADTLRGRDVVVFVSHIHFDHYNRAIFGWRKLAKSIKYVLSDDIQPVPGALMVSAGGQYELEGMKIAAFRSTDEGVAFLVIMEHLTIYHAGDLNWWHWEGEDPQWNADMAEAYKKEIGKLKDIRIGIAFVPVDPRLKESCLLGLNYLMRTARVSKTIPMHYGGQGDYAARAIKRSGEAREYRDHIVMPMKRGDTIRVGE